MPDETDRPNPLEAQATSGFSVVELGQIEGPFPLASPVPEADPFPIESLPSGLIKDAIYAIEHMVQAPLAMAAQSVLAAVNFATQRHIDVRLPHGENSDIPISLFFLTVGKSGERKSACDALALKGVRDTEAELVQVYNSEYRIYLNRKEVYDRERKRILNDKGSTRETAEAKLNQMGREPRAPVSPMLIFGEPTWEGIVKLFGVGDLSLGLFSSEGGAFLKGFAMSEGQQIKTAASLSEAWDDGKIKRVRATDGAVILPGRRLNIHLMAQPDIAREFLGSAELRDQGLLSRFLVSAPRSTQGNRFHRETEQVYAEALDRFSMRIYELLQIKPPYIDGEFDNGLDPRVVKLTPEAREAWIEYHDRTEARLAEGGDLASISGFANKIADMAIRFAGGCEAFENDGAEKISLEWFKAATVCLDHYSEETKRLYEAGRENPTLALAKKTYEWALNVWPHDRVGLRDICKGGPLKAREKGKALQMAQILEDHGWFQRLKNGAIIDGSKRREAWEIVRVPKSVATVAEVSQR